nr:DnaB-like helicase C-terminal domain-containing protein [uncultured Agathobaculum sp.]
MEKKVLESKLELIPASGWGVQDILATALARQHRVVFVDYLQLIRAAGRNRTEQVTNISLALHEMAQAHGILVVALSQLNRASTDRADATPTLADLRESGQIEQDADAVLALYIDPDEDAPMDDRKLRVLKNKEGRLGDFSLAFDGSTQSFAEYMDGQLAAARQIKKMGKKTDASA